MGYPASKHYAHLAPGEPIPEIEPRCNEAMLLLIRPLIRWAPLVVALLLVMNIVLLIVSPPLMTRMALFAGVLVVYIVAASVLLIRFRFRSFQTRRELKYTEEKWGIPISLKLKGQGYMVAIMVLFMQITSVDQGLTDILMYSGIYLVMFGVWLAVASRWFRQPGQISCERCDYPLVGLSLPCSCPECGHALLDLSYATDRPRLRDTRLLVAALLMIALGMGSIYMRIYKPGWMYAPLPRSMLMQMAPDNRDAFSQLDLTNLSAEESQRLVTSLLDDHAGDNWYGVSSAQRQWLEALALSGGLSPAQLDQIMEPQTQKLRIVAPAQARIGREVTLELEADIVSTPGRGFWPDYIFGGYLVGQDPQPHAQTTSTGACLSLVRGVPLRIASAPGPVYRFVPHEPGPVTVHARVVLALFPAAAGPQAAASWSPDGKPLLTPAPIWSCVVDLEHTIDITQ